MFLLSILSLTLAMANNLNNGDRSSSNPLGVPVQVDTSVRVAQYVGKWMQNALQCFLLLQGRSINNNG